MLVSEFDYSLPPELIAQEPPPDRAASRLLHLDRDSGKLQDLLFRDLPGLLRADDLVIFNNTRVFPARLYGKRSGAKAQPVSPQNPAARDFLKGQVEVLLTRQLSQDPNDWQCLVRPGRKIGVGERLLFGPEDQLQAEVIGRGAFGERRIRFNPTTDFFALVDRFGHVPLPPYIDREDRPEAKARTDFREPPELYALNLEGYGIDIPPAQVAAMAHRAFAEYQAEMQTIAAQIAKKNSWPSSDYRDVIKKLKENQLVGDSILPFYQQRLKEIEAIIVKEKLVSLPERPARIRIGSPAESAQQPAPHMVPPPLLNNTGQQGEFVLPLNMPAAPGSGKIEKVDDYTFDAAAWTLIAHEARPGHELQFDSMLEHGVSIARSRYAFNSTNVEGWGLYAEYITKPYMPPEGQLISLQFRLLRAMRAFLDPELQAGKIQPADAMKTLTTEGVFSVPFANQEVERYTFRAPGQANSYFYGYTKLLDLRRTTESTLGTKFDGLQFHDFILSQGLLPSDLMRKAVEEDFIPAHSAKSK